MPIITRIKVLIDDYAALAVAFALFFTAVWSIMVRHLCDPGGHMFMLQGNRLPPWICSS